MILFTEDQEIEHGGQHGIEACNEARLPRITGEGGAVLLEARGNEQAEAAAEGAQGGPAVVCAARCEGHVPILFENAVHGDEECGTHHEAEAVEGKGFHVITAQNLGHEGKAPDDGRGKEHDGGGDLGFHSRLPFGSNDAGM